MRLAAGEPERSCHAQNQSLSPSLSDSLRSMLGASSCRLDAIALDLAARKDREPVSSAFLASTSSAQASALPSPSALASTYLSLQRASASDDAARASMLSLGDWGI